MHFFETENHWPYVCYFVFPFTLAVGFCFFLLGEFSFTSLGFE